MGDGSGFEEEEVEAAQGGSDLPGDEPVRVSSLELFFDLVFVFTITQLTGVIHHHPDWLGVGRALLVLVVVWWMYDAFIFLTNAIPPTAVAIRLLVMASMAAFFTMALAIPDAFGDAGLAFGLAYLFVVVLHGGMFLLSEGGSPRGIVRIAPGNLLGALLLIVAGVVDDPWQGLLWVGVVAIFCLQPFLAGTSEFRIRPAHFVERHGLVLIIVLGESIIAVGLGAAGLPVDVPLVLAATLGLALAAAMWWVWFDGDEERSEVALADVPEERRARVAVLAFGYAFVPIILGVVMVAAGAEEALAHLDGHLSTAGAWLLAGGVALYLLGDVAFRVALGIKPYKPRLVATVVALATVPAGTEVGGELQMFLLVLVLAGLAVIGDRKRAAAHVIDEHPHLA
jgi:low temperature requirement protein LtrA